MTYDSCGDALKGTNRCHRYWSVLGYRERVGEWRPSRSSARLPNYGLNLLQCHGQQSNLYVQKLQEKIANPKKLRLDFSW